VDRCLGTNIVPEALRAIGVRVETYQALYPTDTRVPDHVWIPEVAGRGWVILTKDKRIRHSPVEIEALRNAGARYVCLGAANMNGKEQAECLVEHWKTIDSVVASKRAPLIVSVTRGHVQWLDGRVWRVAKRKR
jgi:hypothetical protein